MSHHLPDIYNIYSRYNITAQPDQILLGHLSVSHHLPEIYNIYSRYNISAQPGQTLLGHLSARDLQYIQQIFDGDKLSCVAIRLLHVCFGESWQSAKLLLRVLKS